MDYALIPIYFLKGYILGTSIFYSYNKVLGFFTFYYAIKDNKSEVQM